LSSASLLFSVFALSLTAFALAACSPGGSEVARQLAPPPGEKTDAAANAPPAPTAMDTFRALAPPEGLKFTPLFSEPVKDADARIKRLEDAVQGLRNDFDTVVPSLVRLVSVEKDMKELVGQLQTLTEQPQAAPLASVASSPSQIPGGDTAGGTETVTAAQAAKAGVPAGSSLVTPEAASKGELPPEGAASPNSAARAQAPMPIAKAAAVPESKPETTPVNPSTGGGVKGVRVGDHSDKTRVVIDLTKKAAFTATLENNGKTLVIDIPGMDLSAIKPFEAQSAALVSGWHVEDGKLKLSLLYASSIKTQSVLQPNGSPYYRLVVDLFSKDVHD
jgi:hypothetical protein